MVTGNIRKSTDRFRHGPAPLIIYFLFLSSSFTAHPLLSNFIISLFNYNVAVFRPPRILLFSMQPYLIIACPRFVPVHFVIFPLFCLFLFSYFVFYFVFISFALIFSLFCPLLSSVFFVYFVRFIFFYFVLYYVFFFLHFIFSFVFICPCLSCLS